jgi:hypothetical protein
MVRIPRVSHQNLETVKLNSASFPIPFHELVVAAVVVDKLDHISQTLSGDRESRMTSHGNGRNREGWWGQTSSPPSGAAPGQTIN